MDLRQLEQFMEVVRTGGFAKAARALNLSQPSLTRNIAALERSLAVELFVRTPKGVVLTDAGHKLLPHAAAVLEELDRAHAEFAEGRINEPARVRVGVSPNFLFDLLPDALAELQDRADALRFLIVTGTYEHLTEALRNHEQDVVLCLLPETIPQIVQRDLVLEPLGHEEAIPVVRAGHPLLADPPDLARLSAEYWAVPHQLSLSYRFESAFFRRGLPVPTQRLNSASMPLIRKAILEWNLAGMLPASFARPDLEAGRLVRLQAPELQLTFTIGMLFTQSGRRDPAISRTTDALRRVARTLFPQ